MIVLGLNYGEINSSAALVKDSKVLSGCPEERFNRQKKTKAFPRQSIDFCLRQAGITLDECDAIGQAWNPGAAWGKFNPLVSGVRARREDYFYALPDNLLSLGERKSPDWVRMDFDGRAGLPSIHYIQHHRTHAANAFFLSPFDEAAILTADWRGEFECMSMVHGRGTDLEVLQTQSIPHSLGMLYATFTELLGYRPDNDEWKVMALSAFHVDSRSLIEKIKETYRCCDDGTLELNQAYYKGALVDQPNLYTQKLVDLCGGNVGKPDEDAGEWHCTVASAMQAVAEDIALHYLRNLYERTKCKTLALGGGVFMNSVFNGKIADCSPFDDIYVSYAPADVGNSIGVALYVNHCVLDAPRANSTNLSYIGPDFSNTEIEVVLKRRCIQFRRQDDIAAAVAKLLSEGEIVAVFNGKMEFGERALGNRSILGDPRNPETKDHINSMIKYRESYRPFAPAVLSEKVSTYFEVPDSFTCYFMEKVVPVAKKHRGALPAITHEDGSGRVQTVKEDHNPLFYRIIAEFEKLTGYPVVLNTSFNINGEPIVLSPDDALNTFFNSGLRFLALGNYLISKDNLSTGRDATDV